MDGSIWKVRNQGYVITKEKVFSSHNYCRLLCVDVFKSTKRINHIASHPESALQQIAKTNVNEMILVINLQITGYHSIVCYFSIPSKSESESESKSGSDTNSATKHLLSRFLEETNTWRDSRFKLLPHIQEGNFIVKKAVGTTPCIIGTKGESSYYSVRN